MMLLAKLGASFILLMSMLFALLPGGFGLMNYKRKSNKGAALLTALFYHTLWLCHVFAIYSIWAGLVGYWWSLTIPIVLLIIFFSTVGKDVSASS